MIVIEHLFLIFFFLFKSANKSPTKSELNLSHEHVLCLQHEACLLSNYTYRCYFWWFCDYYIWTWTKSSLWSFAWEPPQWLVHCHKALYLWFLFHAYWSPAVILRDNLLWVEFACVYLGRWRDCVCLLWQCPKELTMKTVDEWGFTDLMAIMSAHNRTKATCGPNASRMYV